jgi:cobalt-precorrin-5B (C1)-methyltransferase
VTEAAYPGPLDAEAQDDEDESFAPPNRRNLRTGYTTGACATAAAKAATQALLTAQPEERVTIHLPAGVDATFELHSCEVGPTSCRASVIKDAGDDPDVTHGAEIVAEVRWAAEPGIHLRGGVGVGTVTLRGLGLEIGGPAINSVPRKMLTEAVSAVAGDRLRERGLEVTISVPNGEALARKTLNGRLGIVGGISILGTSGIVRPWSTAAWRASVEEAIDVAAANEQRHIVLTTGGRSEKYAMETLGLPELAYVEMGIFTGRALQRCVQRGAERVSLAGMIGKFSKLAQGHFQTHVAGNQVDPPYLAEVAVACGSPPSLAAAIQSANTARHVQELVQEADLSRFFDAICAQVVERSIQHVNGKLDIEALLYDFDGSLLGRAPAKGLG